jgi:hypothetical protein
MRLWLPAGMLAVLATPIQVAAEVSVDADGYVAFNFLDSDRNGYVSRVEARSVIGVESGFDLADSNRDGLLDASEYTSVRSAREAE